jgi:hypothetical protein
MSFHLFCDVGALVGANVPGLVTGVNQTVGTPSANQMSLTASQYRVQRNPQGMEGPEKGGGGCQKGRGGATTRGSRSKCPERSTGDPAWCRYVSTADLVSGHSAGATATHRVSTEPIPCASVSRSPAADGRVWQQLHTCTIPTNVAIWTAEPADV